MKVTKGGAFYTGIISLLLIYGGSILISARDSVALVAAIALGGPIAFAVVGLVTAFAGANVADNYQKSKYYRAELDRNKADPVT